MTNLRSTNCRRKLRPLSLWERPGEGAPRRTDFRSIAPLLAGILLLSLLSAGCGYSQPPSTAAADSSAEPANEDVDYVACYMRGDKAGYGVTTTRRMVERNRELLEITHHSHLGISRFGDSSDLDVDTTSVESPAGEVFRFSAKTKIGEVPKQVTGTRSGDEMLLETGGTSKAVRLPWTSDIRGFHGAEQSLEREPMKPGETRRLKLIVPLVDQVLVADVELAARDYETVELLGRSERLLRVDQALSVPGVKGGGIRSFNWVDERGRLIKSEVPGLEQVNYRTTRDVAMSAGDSKFDLGFDVVVKLAKPMPPPYQTRRVKYAVELKGEDPHQIFPVTPTQQVVSTGPHSAEILVTAPAMKWTDAARPPAEVPGDDALAANSMLESDDPLIASMAAEARGARTDPVEIALALERYVYDTVEVKNFSQALGTALEVARSKQGDCTEHAFLLAALARASGLPSRVAVGLVYVVDQQGFGYHMWTEVFVKGRWLPLDATLGRGGIGASHLKLGDSTLSGPATFTSLLSVVQVLGQLKITVLEVQ